MEQTRGNATEQLIERIGVLADQALFKRRADMLNDAMKLAEVVDIRNLSQHQLAVYHYHLSNVWGNCFKLMPEDQRQKHSWELPEIEKQLIHNRLAVRALETATGALPVSAASAIYTNLANTLFEIGRFVEAIEYWDKSLELQPDFGMALANKGLGLMQYAHLQSDKNLSMILLIEARRMLRKALNQKIPLSARPLFKSHFNMLNSILRPRFRKSFLTSAVAPGKTHDMEAAFESWQMNNRLFLNPLNDLGNYLEAASDEAIRLSSTPDCTESGAGSLLQNHFHLLQREYACAKRLCFEALDPMSHTTSGREPDIEESAAFDDAGIEKLKIAFRTAYSLFDKIAFLVKIRFRLQIASYRVNFRTVWYREGKKSYGVEPTLLETDNWPLRGMYWMSKDLYGRRPDIRKGLSTDARCIDILRNHLEHQCVLVQTDAAREDETDFGNDGKRDIAGTYVIGKSALTGRTLRVLKMTRSALIGLSLADQWEKQRS